MKLSKRNRWLYWGKILLLYSPFVILILFLKTRSGHGGDMGCWIEWAKYGFTEGLSNIYKSWTDYLPLFHYVLFFFGKIQGSVEAIEANMYTLKIVSILFEFGTTLFLFKILEEKHKDIHKAMLFSLFYFLNIAVLINGMIWGQVDGIMAFFIFGAVIFAWNKRIFLSLLFFLLALNMKLQAIIFSPILFLLLLPLILDKSQLKKTVFSFLGIALIQFLIFLPFIYAGDFPKLWNVITGSVDKYPTVSMNAYNLWYFFIKTPRETFDGNIFLRITYKNWGLSLFFFTSFFALLHFVKPLFQNVFKKANVAYSQRKAIISCALVPLLFFFFNTQMHERYSHPALIFLALYALLYNRAFLFVLGSVAYFLNMEDVLQFFQWGNYHTLVFTPWFIACLYLLLIIILFLDLYDINFKKKHKVT